MTKRSLLVLHLPCLFFFFGVVKSNVAVAQQAEARRNDLLHQYCVDCHGSDEPEAGFRLDTFTLEDTGPHHASISSRILSVIRSRRMPPNELIGEGDSQRAFLIQSLQNRLIELSESVPFEPWIQNRRLTNEEYNFTMQSLFDVDATFGDRLPVDGLSEKGFRNSGDRLGLSSIQMEAYFDNARRAVDRYVQFGQSQPQPILYHIEFEDLFYAAADRYRSRELAPKPVDLKTFQVSRSESLSKPPQFVEPLGPKLPGAFSEDEKLRAAIPKLNQQYIALPKRLTTGDLVIRVRAAGTADRRGRYPRLRVEAGITLGDGCSMDKRLLGESEVSASLDSPAIYEFRIRLEDVPTKGELDEEKSFDQLSLFDMDQVFLSNVTDDDNAIFALGRGGYKTPEKGSQAIAGKLNQMRKAGVAFLYLDSIEIQMLPGVRGRNGNDRWQMNVPNDTTGELEAFSSLLRSFTTEAYRRPVGEDEMSIKLKLFNELRLEEVSFEESVRECLTAVLVSPSFLFLETPAVTSDGSPNAYRLASRLSYLLWLSPPDNALLQKARDESLLDPNVLRSEAKRLMNNPKSRRFLDSFCRQWLRLDRFNNIAVSRKKYPTYDDDLAADSIRETLETFAEIFQSGSNALDLIDSDYLFVNDRLADHYGINGVGTEGFQKVTVEGASVRGGLLTQASVLTMNSDGADSHPIRRGVWLLDRLLDTPPPDPPPNVPEIDREDPDFRGLTLRRQIELHRDRENCRSCHEMIDPWGLALENFDAEGRYPAVISDTENETSAPIDCSVTLPGGHRVSGVKELKQFLRENRRDDFSRSLVNHLLTYAMGRSPDYRHAKLVDQIDRRFRDSGYQIKELVLAIIESPSFLSGTTD